MKKVNVTFSLPSETHKLLQSLVGQRKMSAFVTQVVNQALEKKRQELKQAYIEAEQYPDRKKMIEDWSVLDVEGWE